MEYEERPSYWEEWKHVEYLTLDQAAAMLSGIDPSFKNNFSLAAKEPMLEAIKQAVLLFKLEPLLLYEWEEAGYDAILKPVSDATLLKGGNLAKESTVLIADLAAWADSKGIPHHWPRKQSGEATATSKPAPAIPYTEELQVAIDAYEAVRGNPEATRGRSPKQALLVWLEENRPAIGANARELIANAISLKVTQANKDERDGLRSRERNNMLRIVRALSEMAGLPEKGAVPSVERQLQELGFTSPKEETIRKVLKEAGDLQPD